MFAALYNTAIFDFHKPRFRKSWSSFRTSIASLYPQAVELLAFSILSAMLPGACGLPEHRSGAVLECSAHDCETR